MDEMLNGLKRLNGLNRLKELKELNGTGKEELHFLC